MWSTWPSIVIIIFHINQCVEASFHLRSAGFEGLAPNPFAESGELSNEFNPATNAKFLNNVDIDWWSLARDTAVVALISVTLVVGICVCIKFGEQKHSDSWWTFAEFKEAPEDNKRWDKIEQIMQKADVASVDAPDYQQLLKNVAQRVAREKETEVAQSGVLRRFFNKVFWNERNSSAGAVLQTMKSTEAVHWLQLNPRKFQF
mmetsp:Transcript_54050/g.85999  ORF Transcript_54050/g.85999 Transcript_54050/m.85999 type:complete len:203 (-) Transcript_54050:77-685(-)